MHGYVGRGYEGEKVTSVQGRLFTVTLPRTIRIQVVASVACCNADASCGQVAIAALSSASMGYSIHQILSRCLSLANMRTMFPVIQRSRKATGVETGISTHPILWRLFVPEFTLLSHVHRFIRYGRTPLTGSLRTTMRTKTGRPRSLLELSHI